MKAPRGSGWFLAVVSLLASGATQPFGQQMLPFDHVHLAVSNPAEAAAWYARFLEGTPGSTGDRVLYGDTILAFQQARPTPRRASGVATYEHVALSFLDLEAKTQEVAAAGATVLRVVRDSTGQVSHVLLKDPWGVSLALIRDGSSPGVHHVHLRVRNRDDALDWYAEMFGGMRGRLWERLDGVRFGAVWVIVEELTDAPEQGFTGVDHIGWRPTDIDATVAELVEKGARITGEPRYYGELRFAFVEGPGGSAIELTQRPARR